MHVTRYAAHPVPGEVDAAFRLLEVRKELADLAGLEERMAAERPRIVSPIVISGDTAPSESLVGLARGADVLVHEVMYLPAVDRLAARVPHAASLKKHLLASHTSAEDAGRIAQAAGVKLLVLSHFVPPDDPTITDKMWIDAARVHFRGPIVVGKDLLEV